MKPGPMIRYAAQGIRSGKQRVLVAVLAVAFGVMSIIAMSSLAETIFDVLLMDPRYEIGGDAQVWRATRYLTPDDLAQFETETAGDVARWTAVAHTGELVLQVPGSGRVSFLRSGVGFEPGTYPLLGEIALRSGRPVDEVLREAGDVILTRDVVAERGLEIGDTVLVASQLGGSPQPLRLAGVAENTPSARGYAIYYRLETAEILAGRPNPVTDVYLLWDETAHESGDADEALNALTAAGWRTYTPDSLSDPMKEMRITFNLMLKGSGILGLMVGGIGIANTMQVLLARRRKEVAVLKSLGYTRRDVLKLFVLETATIGLSGSLMGAAGGIALSTLLVGVIGNVVTVFLTWRFDPGLVLGGVIVGVVTTVLFAANAILRAIEVRPADVFRQLPLSRHGRLRSLGTFALMSLPFGAIASLILGSVWQGAAVLAAALAGLLAIGGVLAATKWLVLRLLPTFRFHLLRMARNNLRRRGSALVFAMIALFVGTFTLGLALTIIQGAQDQYDTRMLANRGYNLVALTAPEATGAAESVLSSFSDAVGVRYELPLLRVEPDAGTGDQLPGSLQGRETLWDVAISGEPWGTVPGGAYLPAGLDVTPGTITVTTAGGAQMQLTVAGTYEVVGAWDRILLPTPRGILVSLETILVSGDERSYALAAAEVEPGQLEAIAAEVGAQLPDAMVITVTDINQSYQSTFRNLFTFAVIMAALALVAGAVLIANAVSIAMIERRYEIGVMKAMGYTRGQVIQTILLEYGLIATIASVLGLLAVVGFVAVLAMLQGMDMAAELLAVGPAEAASIVGTSIALTMLAVMATAWEPTSVRPLVVLNELG